MRENSSALLGFWRLPPAQMERKRVSQRRENTDMGLFLTSYSALKLPSHTQRKPAAHGEFNWPLTSYSVIIHRHSNAINRQKGKSMLRLGRAAAFRKTASVCVCHLFEPASTPRHPQGTVISKIQLHLVLPCSTSGQAARTPHVPPYSAPAALGGPCSLSLPSVRVAAFWSGL